MISNLKSIEELEKMSKEELNSLIKSIFKDFDDFVESLAFSKNKLFSPPFDEYYNGTGDILSFYHNFFRKYCDHLNAFDKDLIAAVNFSVVKQFEKASGTVIKKQFSLLDDTKTVCNMIFDSISAYFSGQPGLAFEKMEKTLTADNCHLLNLLPILEISSMHFYRVRKNKNKKAFKERKELFHTPFNLRNKCASYRFSIAGYPSLYVAGSLDTSLKESEINDNDYTCICYQTSGKNLKCADLTLPARQLSFWEKYSLVVFYPLIVACSLKVKDEKAPFKPEYIIPQLLFQVLKLHSQHDGICYVSTKYNPISFTNQKQKNFALYVNNATQESGFSKVLSQKLLWSELFSPTDKETSEEIEQKCINSKFEKIEL